jgi:hypothetical protein
VSQNCAFLQKYVKLSLCVVWIQNQFRPDPDPAFQVILDLDPALKLGKQLTIFSVHTSSVADPDPGFGAFLTPRSGIRISFSGSRIWDPKPIFLSAY